MLAGNGSGPGCAFVAARASHAAFADHPGPVRRHATARGAAHLKEHQREGIDVRGRGGFAAAKNLRCQPDGVGGAQAGRLDGLSLQEDLAQVEVCPGGGAQRARRVSLPARHSTQLQLAASRNDPLVQCTPRAGLEGARTSQLAPPAAYPTP